MASPTEAATTLHRRAAARPPALGGGRLVCIDGPAGSGKTTVAEALHHRLPEAAVVHMDDLYDGWSGLATVAGQLHTLLDPLAGGTAGHYRRYDWHAGGYGEQVVVPPTAWLVLEGVGAGHRSFAGQRTLLAWLTAPLEERHRRWVLREGSDARWGAWRRDEERHFAEHHTQARADVVITT